VLFQSASVVLGAFISTGTVWSLSETANALMAIPNLLIIITLSPELVRLVKDYNVACGRESANGGTYEYIKKSKSMRFVSNAEVSPFGGEGC
jgi:hypothetical protein